MRKILRQALATTLLTTLIPFGVGQSINAETATGAVKANTTSTKSKNVIIMIGDGMGPAQVAATRIYSKNKLKKPHLAFDSYYVGQATTFADRGEADGKIVSGEVTDSASAGTAFATGNKTYNAAISVSNEIVAKPFASVVEAAAKKGKATGLVTTTRITHATPAVFGSHVRERDNENAIASQYLNDNNFNVLLGGGKRQFTSKADGGKREDKTIIPDFEAKGYKVVYDKKGLQSIDTKSNKVLGLFDKSHVPYKLDRTESVPSLADMSKKAIEVLSKNPNGFTMMIEGGRIDHGGHSNDLTNLVNETLDFEKAFEAVMEFAKKDGNTSVVVTADHETGGLSLSRDGVYEVNYQDWDKQLKSSEDTIGPKLKEIAKNKELSDDQKKVEIKKVIEQYTTYRNFTDEEITKILKGDGTDYSQEGAFNAVMAKRYMIGWAGHGHSAVDVGVWAYGPITQVIKGQIDNTDIAKQVAKQQDLDLAGTTKALQEKFLYPKFQTTESKEVVYPAVELAKALNIGVKTEGKVSTFKKGTQTLVIDAEAKTAKLNGADVKLTVVDKDGLHLPLEAFNKVANKNYTWDKISERIVLK